MLKQKIIFDLNYYEVYENQLHNDRLLNNMKIKFLK